MRKLVGEITLETFKDEPDYIGRCSEPGCREPEKRERAEFLKGWFRRHVMDTGHRIVIEEVE